MKQQIKSYKKVKNVTFQVRLKSSSTCYCLKTLGKRVQNDRSRDTERSLPELSPGSRYNEVSGVGRTSQSAYLCRASTGDVMANVAMAAYFGPL